MNKNNELKLIKEDGTEIVCEILFTYYSEEYDKNYVIFEVPAEGMLSAASYEVLEDGTNGELIFIEDAQEWEMLEEVVDDYYNSLEEQEEGCHCGCHGECDEDCDCECDDDCDCEEHSCGCGHKH